MLGDGQQVDLYKLLTVIKSKGGSDAVRNGELWDLVGEECGLGVNVGSYLKLVYSKHKIVLDACMKKVSDGKVSDECGLMELEAEVNRLLSKQAENMVAGEEVKGGVDGANEVKSLNFESSGVKQAHNGGSHDLEMKNKGMISEAGSGNVREGNAAMGVVKEVDGGKMSAEATVDVSDAVKNGESGLVNVGGNHAGDISGNTVPVLDSSGGDVASSGLKRKRESLFDWLNWVTSTAKNPCHPRIGSMPDKSKWKSYSNQEAWKKVLLFREAAFYKKESSREQQKWKSQKMHPSMYDNPIPATYHLRERLRRGKRSLVGKQTSPARSSSTSSRQAEGDLDRTPSPRTDDSSTPRSYLRKWASKRIHVGPTHQADVPEWTGSMTYESDPKWSGTQVWPLETRNSGFLIERDPIGKGRQDSCGCPEQGSVDCVRFHISEKKAKVKLELGVAYYNWKLDSAGEDVKHFWTEEEEKKFREVIQSNPPSSERYFWDHIFTTFPDKSRENLVSYYYNVYLLQCIAYKTRHPPDTTPDTPDSIMSDDEESQSELRNVFGQRSRSSILLTPKKRHKKRK